jgi:hypothetical protein
MAPKVAKVTIKKNRLFFYLRTENKPQMHFISAELQKPTKVIQTKSLHVVNGTEIIRL